MKANYKKFLTPVDVVRREYSKPEIVRSFANAGIWESEKILINKYFNKGDSVLDVACGAGRTAIPLVKKGFNVTGIDFLPEMIQAANFHAHQQNIDLEVLLMDANSMKFHDESFRHVVFFYNSFELIWGRSNRIKLLEQIYRILEPGGYFFLTARSGFAFGKRWVAWPWLLLRTYLLKPVGIGNPYLKLCDVFSRGTYHRYQSPFSIKKDLQNIGFEFVLFNSKRNIERNKKATVFTNFSADKSLFFIYRKPKKAIMFK